MLYKIKGIDADKCNGCEKCVKVCHANCFEMIDKDNKIIADFQTPDACDACGDCIAICPVEGSAIVLEHYDMKKHYVHNIDSDKCEACGKCLNLCPGDNIRITEENGKIFAKIINPKKCVADGHCSFCCPVDDKNYSDSKQE